MTTIKQRQSQTRNDKVAELLLPSCKLKVLNQINPFHSISKLPTVIIHGRLHVQATLSKNPSKIVVFDQHCLIVESQVKSQVFDQHCLIVVQFVFNGKETFLKLSL